MSKNKTKPEKKSLRDRFSFKQGAILTDIAIIILGLLMTIFSQSAGSIICMVLGISMCIFGVLVFISYFAKSGEEAFGSFAIVRGTALLGFGVLFIVAPEPIRDFLNIILGIILIISGVIKLQYAVDLIRLKAKLCWLSFLGAAVTIALGVIVFVNHNAAWLMVFLGISFLVNGIWDLAVVILLDKEKKEQAEKANVIDVDYNIEN